MSLVVCKRDFPLEESSSPAGFAEKSNFSRIHPFYLPITGFILNGDILPEETGQDAAHNSGYHKPFLYNNGDWMRCTVHLD